jgi:hypothetical protein
MNEQRKDTVSITESSSLVRVRRDVPSFANAVDHMYLLGDGSLDQERQPGARAAALVYQLRQRRRS